LDGFKADKIMVMIGTNNLHLNTDDEIIEGLRLLIEGIRNRQSAAKIVLMGILPRRNYEARIFNLNLEITQLAAGLQVTYNDIGSIFLQMDNKVNESLFSDGLHPNKSGYRMMRDALLPILK
jgi:lysophospholipase L1-like esterase